ncbi:MAG: 16S rRNA (guanine(527)-N(7))-methyltransferase RsmG [Gammaproteobacteria bacterium]
MQYQDILIKLAYQLGLNLDPLQAEKLLTYLEILIKWNKVYNLCANADFDKMLAYHILDSLSVAVHIDCYNKHILDVGSGAGLPGIPLAILNVADKITLLDSRAKRTVFLTHVIHELQLKNIKVELVRVEKYFPLNNFDLIVSRAFSDLKTFVKLTHRLLEEHNSKMVAMKSDPKEFTIGEEIVKGCMINNIKSFKVPNIQGIRSLVVVEKI